MQILFKPDEKRAAEIALTLFECSLTPFLESPELLNDPELREIASETEKGLQERNPEIEANMKAINVEPGEIEVVRSLHSSVSGMLSQFKQPEGYCMLDLDINQISLLWNSLVVTLRFFTDAVNNEESLRILTGMPHFETIRELSKTRPLVEFLAESNNYLEKLQAKLGAYVATLQ